MTAAIVAVLVKASIIMAAAAGLALVSRRASAARRHMIWTISAVALLALPLLTVTLPALQIPVLVQAPIDRLTGVADRAVNAPLVPVPQTLAATSSNAAPPDAPVEPPQPMPWAAIIVTIYLAGVLVLLVQLAAQQLAIRRLTRRAMPVVDPEWLDLISQCRHETGVTGGVRILRSLDRTMPMAFGVLEPSVLIPSVADTWDAGRRRAVLRHELAHVARRDCLTQLVARFACALYWPHPGSWLIARRLRVERELACDDQVIAIGTAAPEYAQHLLDLAYSLGRHRAPALVVSMARPKQLEGRMLAVLDHARNRTTPAARFRVAAFAAAGLLVVPLAAAEISAKPEAVTYIAENGAAIPSLDAMSAPATSPDQSQSRQVATRRETTTRREFQWPGTWQLRKRESSTLVQLNLSERPNSMSGFQVRLDELKGLSSAALSGAGGPVQFSLHREAGTINFEGTIRSGVGAGTFTFAPNAAFVGELSKRGYARPNDDELYVLARNDIGTAYLDELAAQKYTRPSLDELLRAGDHGVDLEYLRDMGHAGYHLGEIESLIRTRDHGVDREFMDGLKSNGLTGLSVEQLVRARDHGVDPEYIGGMKRAGFDLRDLDALVQTRDHGVDPDYIAEMKNSGYDLHDLQGLIRARNHGVDAEYIQDMRRHGYKLSITDLIRARDHGVDAEFVSEFAAQGYKDLTIEELVRLRDHGVSPDWAKRQNNRGSKLSVEELVRRRDRGGDR